ncbi:KH domain-containing protein [Candidatus Uhrbacteria bacterium]|nr:KH domain-containing protein [Candidatus Uhrbacteria bacterium]MBT7716988.1 KH domain-containing protein [Candidatus Uhrbacteria bacterium]
MSKEFDQEFTEFIVKAIVNNPDDVRTERTVDERGVLITLHINPEDMGYVVGRQGQTARAIRTLLKKIGARENARVNLKIYEPEGSRQQHLEQKAAAAASAPAAAEESAPESAPAPVVEEEETDTSVVDNLTF